VFWMAQDRIRRGRTAKESPNFVTQTLAPHAYACSPRICVPPITPTPLVPLPAQPIFLH
ncbi:hypothetical protein PIB30_094522, partial [Stylosanthes scabra]|nr:hypothetical protein [Stylosanthes scabra]